MATTRLFHNRAFGLVDRSARSLGKPAAAFPGRVATDKDFAIAVDLQQTKLALPMGIADATMTVQDPSVIAPYSLLTIGSEIVQATGPAAGNVVPVTRGFDGTTPAAYPVGVPVMGNIDAYHHNRLVAEMEAVETALGANLTNIAGTIFLNSDTFNYPAQTPGGTLAVGANTITMMVPPGVAVNGTAYISGGTGAAEVVPVNGVSASSIIVTCANAHSGAWTIQSATAGIQEALAASAGTKRIYIPPGIKTLYTTINITSSAYLFGAMQGQEQTSTVLQNAHTGHTITPTGLQNKTLVISDMYLKGTASSGDGIHMINCSSWVIERLWITNHGGHGFYHYQCYGGVERDVCINSCAKHGSFFQQCNDVLIERPTYNSNGTLGTANYSGIFIDGQSASTQCTAMTIFGGSTENNGAGSSGMGIGAVFCQDLTIIGHYQETNTVFQTYTDETVLGFVFIGNFCLGNQPTIGAHYGVMYGNTFRGGSNGLTFGGTNQSLDVCGNQYVSTPSTTPGTSGCFERYPAAAQTIYLPTETGANNAIAATIPVPLTSGMRICVKLAHSLQAGANTFNGTAIKSIRNPANNIATAYAPPGSITMLYDAAGPYYLDVSQ